MTGGLPAGGRPADRREPGWRRRAAGPRRYPLSAALSRQKPRTIR
jgi:hypothetical protein